MAFQIYYTHNCFPTHYLHYDNYGEKIIAIIRLIGIIAIIYMYPLPAHLSGIWLQILGLTGRMHSYTSGAAIAAKKLRHPGGR